MGEYRSMKVLHVNAGLEDGGGLTHIIGLLEEFNPEEIELLTFAEGPVAKAAREKNISVKVMNSGSRYNLKILKQIKEYINGNNFDIVHSHGPRANLYLRIIHKKIRAKWIITVHSDPRLDFMNQGLKGKIFTKINLGCLKKADGIFAVTERFKKILLKLGIKEQKIVVIHNGIEFDKTIPSKIPHETFEIVNVGRLHPVKGQVELIKAFDKANLANAKLTIVGDGPAKKKLQETIENLKLSDKINMTGFLNHETINQIYLKSDISVLSSISESFPLVLLEAANYELPLISTDVGDISLMIPNKEMGWIVPTNDISALSSALQEAYKVWKSGLLPEYGKKLREYTMEHFSKHQLFETTIDGYKYFLK